MADVPAASSNIEVPQEWPGAFGILQTSKKVVLVNRDTMLVLFILTLLLSVPGQLKGDFANGLDNVSTIASIFVSYGLTVTALAGLKSKKVNFAEAFTGALSKKMLKYFGALIVSGLAAIASLILLIVPFFFVLPRIMLVPYLVVDKDLGPIDALKESWRLTKGHSGKAWGIIGATLLFSIGIIVLVGLYYLFIFQAAFALLYAFILSKEDAQPVSNEQV